MDRENIIVSVKSMDDISKINRDTKYINVSIDNVNMEVIDYFLLHGQNFSYSDTINDRNGFIYSSYDMFKNGEVILDNIIDNMPSNLNDIQKARYIYISLGKILSVDINTMDSKNDVVSFGNISTINNIWGALYKKKITDISISKLFMYLCSRIGIKSELISSGINGHIANKVYVDSSYLVVDLYSDIYNIQGGFVTRYFDKYNNDKNLDKKVLYIREEYTDYYIDNALGGSAIEGDFIDEILSRTQKILDINNIGVVELSKIYRDIFDKYTPNYDIKINNFYACDGFSNRQHFIMISYNGKCYSFNYSRECFSSLDHDMIIDNLNSKKIGLYDNEEFNVMEKGMVL